jgi:calcium-dependent protein kinase
MTWVISQYGGREVLADYEFGQTLGCGTFGVTRLVTHRKTASPWACKTICKASIAASPAAQSDVQHEVAILQHLKGHGGIVQLKGVYEDERNIHLVMELCTGGDLLDYISRFQRLQEDEAADVTSVMLSTLAHCHRYVMPSHGAWGVLDQVCMGLCC